MNPFAGITENRQPSSKLANLCKARENGHDTVRSMAYFWTGKIDLVWARCNIDSSKKLYQNFYRNKQALFGLVFTGNTQWAEHVKWGHYFQAEDLILVSNEGDRDDVTPGIQQWLQGTYWKKGWDQIKGQQKTQRSTLLKQERKGEKMERGKDHAKIFKVNKAKQESQRKGSKRQDTTKKRTKMQRTLQLVTHVPLRDTPYFILFLRCGQQNISWALLSIGKSPQQALAKASRHSCRKAPRFTNLDTKILSSFS